MSLGLDLNIGKKGPALSEETLYDMIVIGGGPAGLSAALYAKRKGLNVAMIADSIGGQVADTSTVENYLGYPEITGEGLVQKFHEHVKGLKVPTKEHVKVERVEDGIEKTVILSDGTQYKSKTVLLATGSNNRKLGIPGEQDYYGKGVTYCAICDGPLFEGRDVIVAGGGNSAVEAAIDLSKIANKVYLIHRSQFRADQILIDRLNTLDNVEVYLEHQLLEVHGEMMMSGVKALDKKKNEEVTFAADGLFVEIGYVPNSVAFKGLANQNEQGEILVDDRNRTSAPGIFAAGDVTNVAYKQIIISSGEGAKAALAANDYLNTL